MADIYKFSKEDQERWLDQRGWQPSDRTGVRMWRHPETGIPYNHIVALRLALEECKLPADTELNPVVPPTTRDG